MRLFLAAAVLLVALVAYAEGQDSSLEDTFTKVRDQMTSFGSSVAERTKSAFDEFSNSEFAVQSKNWLNNAFETIKKSVSGQ